MKRLGLIALIVLAINFLAVASAGGWLVASGKLDGETLRAIAKLIFPDPPPPAARPTTAPTTRPLFKFDELLVKQSGKTATEQVAFMRETFDAMGASLDRQHREVIDLRRQLDLAQSQVARDRAAVDARERAFEAREKQRQATDADEGFAKTLEVYDAMDAKQVKEVFAKLDEETVVRYLQAMEPRRVSKVLKEFSSPDESSKAQSLLERMRRNDASAGVETPEAEASAGPPK